MSEIKSSSSGAELYDSLLRGLEQDPCFAGLLPSPSPATSRRQGPITVCDVLQSFEAGPEWQGQCLANHEHGLFIPSDTIAAPLDTVLQTGLASLAYYNVIFCLSSSTEPWRRKWFLQQFIAMFSMASLPRSPLALHSDDAVKGRRKLAILVKNVHELVALSWLSSEYPQHSFFIFHGANDIRHALSVDFRNAFEHASILVTTIYHFLDALRHGFTFIRAFEALFCSDMSAGSHSYHAYSLLMKEFMTPSLAIEWTTALSSRPAHSAGSVHAGPDMAHHAQGLPRLMAWMEPLDWHAAGNGAAQAHEKLYHRIQDMSRAFHARFVLLDVELERILARCARIDKARAEASSIHYVPCSIDGDEESGMIQDEASLGGHGRDGRDKRLALSHPPVEFKMRRVLSLYRRQLDWMCLAPSTTTRLSKVTLVVVAETAHVGVLRELLDAYQTRLLLQVETSRDGLCRLQMPIVLQASSKADWLSLWTRFFQLPCTLADQPLRPQYTIVLPCHVIPWVKSSFAERLLQPTGAESGMELQCLVLDVPPTLTAMLDLYVWHQDAQLHHQHRHASPSPSVRRQGPGLTFLVPHAVPGDAQRAPCATLAAFLHRVAQWRLGIDGCIVSWVHAAHRAASLDAPSSLLQWTAVPMLGRLQEDATEPPLPARVHCRTGATLDLYSATEILQRFCQYLPRDKSDRVDGCGSKRSFAQMAGAGAKQEEGEMADEEEVIVMGNPALAQPERYRCQPMYETVQGQRGPGTRASTQRKERLDHYQCQVRLPTLLPRRFQHLAETPIQGLDCRSKALARMTAAYQAVMLLLENGLLNDHLLPCELRLEHPELRVAHSAPASVSEPRPTSAKKRFVYYPVEQDPCLELVYPKRIPRAFQPQPQPQLRSESASATGFASGVYYVYGLRLHPPVTPWSSDTILGLVTCIPLPENMPCFCLEPPPSPSRDASLLLNGLAPQRQAEQTWCRIGPIASSPLALRLDEFDLVLGFQPYFFKLLSTRNSILVQSPAHGPVSSTCYKSYLEKMRLEMRQSGALAEPPLFSVPDDKKIHYWIVPLMPASQQRAQKSLLPEQVYYEQYVGSQSDVSMDAGSATTLAVSDWTLDWGMMKRVVCQKPRTLKTMVEGLCTLAASRGQERLKLEALIRHVCARTLVHEPCKDVIYSIVDCHFSSLEHPVSSNTWSTTATATVTETALPVTVRVDRLKGPQNHLARRGGSQPPNHGSDTEKTTVREGESQTVAAALLGKLCERQSVLVLRGGHAALACDEGLVYDLTERGSMRDLLSFGKEREMDPASGEPWRMLASIADAYRHGPRKGVRQIRDPSGESSSSDGDANVMRPDSLHLWPLDRGMAELAILLPSILHQVFFYANVDDFFTLSGLQTALKARPSLLTSAEALTGPAPGYRRPLSDGGLASGSVPFDYERLEVLGDSLLKLSVSADLFLGLPQASEGTLTVKRAKLVSNANLYRVGHDRLCLAAVADLSGFAPRTWSAPHLSLFFNKAASSHRPAWPLRPLFDECLYWYELQRWCDTSERRDAGSGATARSTGGAGCEPAAEQGESMSSRSHRQFASKYGSKTIADMVESLIGAYYLDAGVRLAQRLMQHVGLVSGFVLEGDWNVLIEPQLATCADEGRGETRWTRMFPLSPAYVACRAWPRDMTASMRDTMVEHLYACEPPIEELEGRLGHRFRDRRLLYLALTHESLCAERCYGRLEFLGDAVLDWAITRYYYGTCGPVSPGRLTELRAAAVSNVSYARLAVCLGLPWYVKRVESDATRRELSHYRQCLWEPARDRQRHGQCNNSIGLTTMAFESDRGPSVSPPKIFSDVFESLAGAVFLDLHGDLDAFWSVYEALLKRPLDDIASR